MILRVVIATAQAPHSIEADGGGMSENDQPETPVAPPADAPAAEAPAAASGPPPPSPPPAAVAAPRTRLRDRLFTFRSTLAVALAGVIIGAGAGTAITAVVADDGGQHGRHERLGDRGPRGGFGRMPGPGGQQNQPGEQFQVPPGTAPEEQEQSTAPQEGSSNS